MQTYPYFYSLYLCTIFFQLYECNDIFFEDYVKNKLICIFYIISLVTK